MEQSMRLGRIAGIEIGFNWSLLVVFWLISWTLAAARFPAQSPGYGTAAYWSAGVATAVVFFASLVAHELGHAIVARRAGVKVERITLWLFGGIAHLRGEALTPGAELRIAAVGPAISLVLGAAFGVVAVVLSALDAPSLAVGASAWLGVINVVLAVFNLVPAFPLDGGRVLRGALWRRWNDRLRATKTAATAGRVFAFVLIGLGVVEFAFGAGLGGLWFVFLGWFLLNAASAEESQVLLTAALRDVHVRDIMSRDPVTAPASLSVNEFIDDYVMRHRFTTFPIRDADGIVGLVTLARVKDVAPEDRGKQLRDIACPLDDVPTADADDPVIRVLQDLQGCSDGRALVLDDGRLVGIISPRDVQRALEHAGLRARPA